MATRSTFLTTTACTDLWNVLQEHALLCYYGRVCYGRYHRVPPCKDGSQEKVILPLVDMHLEKTFVLSIMLNRNTTMKRVHQGVNAGRNVRSCVLALGCF